MFLKKNIFIQKAFWRSYFQWDNLWLDNGDSSFNFNSLLATKLKRNEATASGNERESFRERSFSSRTLQLCTEVDNNGPKWDSNRVVVEWLHRVSQQDLFIDELSFAKSTFYVAPPKVVEWEKEEWG